ncbi:MAG: hypothetical protein FWH53_10610, partial [Leptospirales bacterium]|nr:hypothetical protein [Leptospirales bacterium]
DKNCVIESFNKDRTYLPKDWNIIGICRNMVLIEYGNVVYLIDFPVLLNKLIELNKKIDLK